MNSACGWLALIVMCMGCLLVKGKTFHVSDFSPHALVTKVINSSALIIQALNWKDSFNLEDGAHLEVSNKQSLTVYSRGTVVSSTLYTRTSRLFIFTRPIHATVGDYVNVVATAECRNARTWPFLATSIWNTPIGSGAIFHDPGIFHPPFPLPHNFFSDDDYFIVTSSNDPLTPWYNQGWWDNPSGEAHCNVTGPFVANISFPGNLTVREFDSNNAAALLQPDNHTIVNTQPLYRCTPGSPVLSLLVTGVEGKDDIVFGNGTWGAHGGSGLSSIGGTIRLGELLPDAPPIRHALKLQLHASSYYFDRPPGYVWPALQCDDYAFNPKDPAHYAGDDIYLSLGALLAIPSNTTVNVTTVPGQKLLFTLQNYGGYLCDDTYFNRGTVNTEHGVTDEFQAAYGYPFNSRPTGRGAAWYADMLALFQSLHVVVNNNNRTIGGGGTPLQPPPPPICPI